MHVQYVASTHQEEAKAVKSHTTHFKHAVNPRASGNDDGVTAECGESVLCQ
jgi:hypothetical protein